MTTHMTNFRGEDMPGNVSYAKGSEPKKEPAPAPQPVPAPEPEDSNEVPVGTTAEILAWVGDDQERAQAALDKEYEDDSPRKGLTGELNKILGNDDDEE